MKKSKPPIRDPKRKKIGSKIIIPDPQHCFDEKQEINYLGVSLTSIVAMPEYLTGRIHVSIIIFYATILTTCTSI
jgi:hypothetical protein